MAIATCEAAEATAITYLTFAPPTPMEQNAAWQALNKAMNVTLPKFLRSRCTDLMPYLSGEAIKDYPNLAR